MDWLWTLFEPVVLKEFERAGRPEPSEEEVYDAFVRLVGRVTVTVLVQEPHRGSVRFKGLERVEAAQSLELLRDPEGYLRDRFGGGKFKLNFHDGWHFIATQNFKPDGEPRWRDLPEVEY